MYQRGDELENFVLSFLNFLNSQALLSHDHFVIKKTCTLITTRTRRPALVSALSYTKVYFLMLYFVAIDCFYILKKGLFIRLFYKKDATYDFSKRIPLINVGGVKCSGVAKGGSGGPDPTFFKYDPRGLFKNVKKLFQEGCFPYLQDFGGRGSKNTTYSAP